MGQIQRFTTISVKASARLDFWNQLASETYPGLFIDAPEADLRADMLRWKLGDVTLSRPRSQASVAQRTRPSGEPAIMLHYQRYGTSRQSQRGTTCDLRAGDLALCSSDEPYRLELSPKHELFVVELPPTRSTLAIVPLLRRFDARRRLPARQCLSQRRQRISHA